MRRIALTLSPTPTLHSLFSKATVKRSSNYAVASDDDSGEGRNAQIVFESDRDQILYISVTGADQNFITGPYTLSVTMQDTTK